MTILEKVKGLRPALTLCREEAVTKQKEWSFGLLHDALLFTDDEAIDEMTPQALAGFVELMAVTQMEDHICPRAVRKSLLDMGFRVTPCMYN